VIEHVPAPSSATEAPETVQIEVLFEANETARPLDAAADSATGPWSARVSDGCVNVIVCACGAAVTWNVFVTGVAAAYDAFPACDAVIEHVPVVSSVTVVTETVQTLALFELKLTVKPLDAVAERMTGPWSTRVSAGCANVIDCACGAAVTWNVFVTGVAAA
jgi:hypothetical protein